jgi:hypothetical protein
MCGKHLSGYYMLNHTTITVGVVYLRKMTCVKLRATDSGWSPVWLLSSHLTKVQTGDGVALLKAVCAAVQQRPERVWLGLLSRSQLAFHT